MQHSPVGQSRRRSNSPVFFTGCTTTLPKFQKNEPSPIRTVTTQDFENMRLILNSQSVNVASAISKPALLPDPSGVKAKVGCESQVSDISVMRTPINSSPLLNSTPRSALHAAPRQMKSPMSDNSINETFSEPETPEYHVSRHRREGPYSEYSRIDHTFNTVDDSNQEEFYSAKRKIQYCDSPKSHMDSNSRKRKSSPDGRQVKNARRSYPHTIPRQVWDQLSHDIWKLFHDNRQTPEVYQMKMTLRNELHHILKDTFPSCGLYVVGSSMSGIGSNKSDMDMCLMLSHSEIDQDQEAANILQTVYDTFIQYDFLLNVELIRAKVPILRFKDIHSAIEVDLNINNSVGIRNTQLLTSYSRIDERVPPLILLTKQWARCHGINDAKNHTLSSYSLVLMVIHYLQYGCVPQVLPCLQKLQPDKFQIHVDVRTLSLKEDLPPFRSENIEQLGELFLGFLDYFANRFNFASHVMSVRTGGILLKTMSMNNTLSPKNKRAHWKYLCIEEPFNLTNTACSVFKDSAFYYVRDVFMRSWNALRSSGNLGSILNMEDNRVNYPNP